VDITSIDHLEMFVEDAEHTAIQLCTSYGFVMCGRGGPETGLAGCRSILLRQRNVTLLITSPIDDDHRAVEYLRRHGDGVAVVGLAVDDAQSAFTEAVKCGALPLATPTVFGSQGDSVTFASVNGFGDVEHRFVSRQSNDGLFAPGVIEEDAGSVVVGGGLLVAIDHLAVLVPPGTLESTTRHYREVFGFTQTYSERIQFGQQAMDSKVMENAFGTVTFTIIEPDTTRDPGQIDRFLDAHGGAGVQHIAFLTSDIAESVRTSSAEGVRFLVTPPAYYDELNARLGSVGVPLDTLRELNILADRDRWGVMLQIFTESDHPRRTLFYELIDRRGARTFGSNNIKALYAAVERQRDTIGHARHS
jgi:4-hydroxymandelate synthase